MKIRNDCAFCGYERFKNDRNHGPNCSYWVFFGPCKCGFPETRKTHSAECQPGVNNES